MHYALQDRHCQGRERWGRNYVLEYLVLLVERHLFQLLKPVLLVRYMLRLLLFVSSKPDALILEKGRALTTSRHQYLVGFTVSQGVVCFFVVPFQNTKTKRNESTIGFQQRAIVPGTGTKRSTEGLFNQFRVCLVRRDQISFSSVFRLWSCELRCSTFIYCCDLTSLHKISKITKSHPINNLI